jgi:hypothetical protein
MNSPQAPVSEDRHPADLYGHGRQVVFMTMRAVAPREYILARKRHGDSMAAHDLWYQNHLKWELSFFDQHRAQDPHPYCTHCSHLRGEHSDTCWFSPRGIRYMEWVRVKLARHTDPTAWRHFP